MKTDVVGVDDDKKSFVRNERIPPNFVPIYSQPYSFRTYCIVCPILAPKPNLVKIG